MGEPSGIDALEAIDYDRLWADYLQSLVDTLRGFTSGLDDLGLHAFVPSEDPAVSLRNLLDAAAAVGRPALTVRFGPATRPRIDAEALRVLAAGYGHARLLATETELLVAVAGLHPAAAAAPAVLSTTVARPRSETSVAAEAERIDCYAAALASAPLTHAGPPPANASLIEVSATADGATLYLQIDPRHVITAAGFAGAPASLLDRLCAIITDLPLLEAAHHGVIHLEAALRAPGTRPVAGVITPRAAHARFALPAALIRQALASYRTRTGYADTMNRHDPGPGPAWRAASNRERAARIAAVAGPDATLVAIEHDVRLVFELPATLDGDARQRCLWQLEARIRQAIDPRLEVHAEERRDRNKLRRLGSRKESEGA